MSPSGTTYVDSDGDNFHLGLKGTVTLHGSHFHGIVPMITLVVCASWLVVFIAVLIAIIHIRRHAKKGDRALIYLKWPVMGFSTILLVLAYAFNLGNRIIHEMELTTTQYILTITIPESITAAYAQNLLIAFLLWQLMPTLLNYCKYSAERTKSILWLFKAVTAVITVLNTADEIISAYSYIMKLDAIFGVSSSDDQEIHWLITGYDAYFNAGFSGLFLLCTIAFAIIAWKALEKLHHGGTLEERFRRYLPLLTVAVVLRALLDFIWSIVFKYIAITRHTSETPITQLVQTILTGLFSAVAYFSILRISTLNDADSNVLYNVVGQLPSDGQNLGPQTKSGKPITFDDVGDLESNKASTAPMEWGQRWTNAKTQATYMQPPHTGAGYYDDQYYAHTYHPAPGGYNYPGQYDGRRQ